MHRLTSICVRHPWATVGLALALTVVAGWSVLRTQRGVGTDASLGADHPAVRQFTEFLERFGGGYPVLIAWECDDPRVCETVFDPASLDMANAVSRQLEQARFVSRISSPATTRLLVPSADLGIDARQFVVDGRATENSELKRLALHDPLWLGNLVSQDGAVGAIVVELTSTDSTALLTVIDEIRRALHPYAEKGFRFHLVGEAVMWVAAQEDAISTALRTAISTGGMLFLTLLLLIRSLPAVVASLATIGIASAWTMGMLRVLDWKLSELTTGAATLILVIGCADCIHFVAYYLENRSRFNDDATALSATTRWVLPPCFLTTATTVGAFLSFATGGVLSPTQFGVMSAIGVSLAFVLTFSLLPALLMLLPAKPRRRHYSAAWQEVLGRLADFGSRRKRIVLAVAIALSVIGAAGIPKLRVELSLTELWSPDHPVMRAIDFVSENLQRPDRVEIEIALPAEARIEDPMVLKELADVQESLGGVYGLGEPRSILTLLAHTNRLLRPETLGPALPNSEAAAGELITLISAGDAGALDSWTTLDHRRLRISVEAHRLPLAEKERVLAQLEELLIKNLPPGWDFSLTGPVALAARYGAEFGRSQTTIISASSLIVFVLIGIYLRSLPWALLAMIPNAVALVLLFGAMGHWGVNMDFGSAMVAPIAIGIAADDTIHFLTAYARERRSGLVAVEALRGAISDVGEAVIATAIALALGFLSMMTSPFPSIGNIGLLGAVAIIAATLADLLVLPALIATVAQWKGFGGVPGRHG